MKAPILNSIGAFAYSEKGKGPRIERGPFLFQRFLPRSGSGLGLQWLPADCATHCLPQALCICTSVTRCEYILVSSAPTSMLATVTDAHMPGDLVQSAGEVFWLSSLFLFSSGSCLGEVIAVIL